MMIAKLYGVIWLFVGVAALAAYVTDSFNSTILTIFGFLVSTLFFMGIVGVLPAVVDEHYSSKYRNG